MRKLITIIILLTVSLSLNAQDKKVRSIGNITIDETLTDEYLDTVNVKKQLKLNDYSMIGVQYGAGLSRVMWNPSQKQQLLFIPMNVGVTFTRYGKMFGYMPYFGFQAGIFYTQEGYKFEYNEEKKYTYTIEGADKAVMDVIEIPLLSHIHFDFWHFKVIAQIGMFGGYRLSIQRFAGPNSYLDKATANDFTSTDIRWDYGIKGGLGFGLVFDPIELHFQAMYKHSMSSLYQPDYHSEYYYRFAYPSNIVISVGLHFQLTKRSGMTKHELKNQARNIVYGTSDINSKGR